MAEVVLRDEVVAAPRCSLNAPLSPQRRFRVVRADLAELKRVKDALGGTVNDVILAAVTGRSARAAGRARRATCPRRGCGRWCP